MQDGRAVLNVQSIVSAEDPDLLLHDVSLQCDSLELTAEKICASSPWSFVLTDKSRDWQLPVAGVLDEFRSGSDRWALSSSVSSGNLLARVSVDSTAEGFRAALDWTDQLIRELPDMTYLPPQIEWIRAGASSGSLAMDFPKDGVASCEYRIRVDGLGFDSPEGRFAGEQLALVARGKFGLGEDMDVRIDGDIESGDLLIDNFYVSFSDLPLHWEANLTKRGSLITVSDMHLADGRSLDIKAAASFDLDDPVSSLRYRVGHVEMHFPQAYQRYLESMASAWTLDGLTVTGSLYWSGDRDSDAFSSGVLDIQDLTIVDRKRGRFALTGLAAHILPGDEGVESHFFWRGLLFQRINLGAGEAAVKAEQGQFSLSQPMRLNVLGGVLALEDLRVMLPGTRSGARPEPQIELYATLEDMEMEQLTQALGWPSFGGSISGKIPGVKLNEGVLAVEGQIEFNVFDGQILLSGLHIERPFGVLPSLAANLRAENLDLQQLTSTFSFGRISGRLSGFVNDLRMLDWKPVAFDAWFGTPEQESGSHKISRQAVKNLTTIGGGSATAALTGPLMKFFNNFSYKRLGLGCKLQNYICEVRGLDDDESSGRTQDHDPGVQSANGLADAGQRSVCSLGRRIHKNRQ